MKNEKKVYSHDEWRAEATRRFGEDPLQWKFVCPVCGYVASVQDWKEAGASEGAAAFSCVGRWKEPSQEAFSDKALVKGVPCNYAGGGLFRLNPVEVLFEGEPSRFAFDFAPDCEELREKSQSG